MSNGSHGSSSSSTGHNASVNGTSTIITTTEEYNNVDRIRNSTSVPRDPFLLPVNLNATNNTNNSSSNYINNVAATTTTTIAMAPLILPLSQINPTSATITSTATTSTTAMTTSTTGLNMISTTTSIAAAAAVTTVTSPIAKGQVVSEKTLDALGDWLLESASVQSLPPSQEQRRKQSYKSGSLINKTMKQSQEERRRQALAEQAKKRYQFTNHARKLALFASGQQSEESSDSDGSDSQDEEDDDEDEDEDENEDEEDDEEDNNEDNSNDTDQGKKKKKRGLHKKSSADKGKNDAQGGKASPVVQTKAISTHKRRLSFGSESESQARRKTDSAGDILSPKKPRLQKKKSSDIAKKKRRRDRNPFRDQMMVPEALTDIPEDLDANYYIVPLPIGHRCFVISADGKTTARLPSGQLLVSAFESCLPAGSSQYRGNRRSDYCILDCVYSSVTRTFWTMDIMCWRGHPVYECETEFRFWWLRGKLAEIEELQGKWIASQTKEWEHDLEKKRMKRARQIKKRQEKAAAAAAANAMDGIAIEPTDIAEREEDDEGDDGTGIEGMEVESNSKDGGGTNGNTGTTRKFWPVVFTPLPYFNASINLVRLLAESMHQPTPTPSLPSSPPIFMPKKGPIPSIPPDVHPSIPLSSPFAVPLTTSTTVFNKSTPVTSLSLKSHPKSTHSTTETSSGSAHVIMRNGTSSIPSSSSTLAINSSSYSSCTAPPSTLGTMALSGEIATAASLFPAHDKIQKQRQDQTLLHERAAGLLFFNKKTMYVLGSTPLCGWVSMDQVGDVFFDEEGGVGPVPGTSAAEGREVEMEDALERIRI